MPSAKIEWNKMVGYGMWVFVLVYQWRYIEFCIEYTLMLKLCYIMLHDFTPSFYFQESYSADIKQFEVLI